MSPEEEFNKFESLCKKYHLSKKTVNNYDHYKSIEIKESKSKFHNPKLNYFPDQKNFQLDNFSKNIIDVLFWHRKWGIKKKSLIKYFKDYYIMSKYTPYTIRHINTYFGIGLKTENLEDLIIEINIGTPHEFISQIIKDDPLALELAVGFFLRNETQIIDYIQDKDLPEIIKVFY